MTYREAIIRGMEQLTADPAVVVMGYNLRFGSKAYGTLKAVPSARIIEMPCAEALMTGAAIGLSLTGKKPILFFERQDFLTLAMDALINHLALIKELSRGEYNPKLIIRAVIGGTKPFDAGLQHSKRLIDIIKHRVPCLCFEPATVAEVVEAYNIALHAREERTVIISETRDLYDSVG